MGHSFTGEGYLGNYNIGDVVGIKFNTHVVATGGPLTLAGSPVISVYINTNTTEITTGVTLTVDYDSRTGLNDVQVDTASGYAAGDHAVTITTGTTGATSAVGFVVGYFSLGAVRSANTKWVNGTAQTARDLGLALPAAAPAAAGGLLISAAGISGANLDTYLVTNIPAISTRVLLALPAVAAGGSGGVFISGTNTGTTVFGALTVTGGTTLTGALISTHASNNVTGVAVTSAELSDTATAEIAAAVAVAGVPGQGRTGR